MEGVSHEAISLAGHLKLSRLIVLFDDNSITIDGLRPRCDLERPSERFNASNWNVQPVDGFDQERRGRAPSAKRDRPPTSRR